MKLNAIAATMLLALSPTIQAADTAAGPSPERAALLREYAQSLGVEDTVTRNLADSKKRVGEQLGSIFKQFENVGVSSQGIEEIRAYYRQVFDKAVAAVDPAEVTRVYMAALDEQMPDDALKAAIEYARSENGRRAFAAALTANKAAQDYAAKTLVTALAAEVQGSLIPKLQEIVQRDQARRRQAAGSGQAPPDNPPATSTSH